MTPCRPGSWSNAATRRIVLGEGELRKQMDALLALGLSDREMREALDVLGSEYVPNEATAWVRYVKAKVG